MQVVQLAVPYRSQWDRDADLHSADCGPTSLAMVLNAHGVDITPNQLYDFLPPKEHGQFVKISELMQASAEHNLPLRYRRFDSRDEAMSELLQLLDNGYAPIALVSYAPWQSFTRNLFKWGHFVVVSGYTDRHIFVHDPLFGLWERRERGNYLRMTRDLFLDGWGGFPPLHNPNFALMIPSAQVAVDRQTIDLARLDALRARLAPNVKQRILALAAYVGAPTPNLDDADELDYWLANVGDWGKQTAVHRVRRNDTLGGIAIQHYGDVSRWRAIGAFNNIAGTAIWLGQRLEIPLHDEVQTHERLAAELPVARGMESAEILPDFDHVFDYNNIGANSVGMGFVDEPDA